MTENNEKTTEEEKLYTVTARNPHNSMMTERTGQNSVDAKIHADNLEVAGYVDIRIEPEK